MKRFIILLIVSIVGGLLMVLLKRSLGIEFKESVTSLQEITYLTAYIILGAVIGQIVRVMTVEN